ncbi:MAG: hypothetical protein ACI9BW_000909 [Gammaproteobacteria bacterium]
MRGTNPCVTSVEHSSSYGGLRPELGRAQDKVNTPAHAIVNLALLGRKGATGLAVGAIVLGAMVPDIPIVLFYLIEKFVRCTPEAIIWGELYEMSPWYVLTSTLHSFVVVGGMFVIFRWIGKPTLALFSLSMVLHSLGDIFVHTTDAHRHFFPVSDYQFVSPVSYWDPNHFGIYFFAFELLSCLVLSIHLIRKNSVRNVKPWVLSLLGLYVAGIAYALFVWAI